MTPDAARRTLLAASCVTAPILGFVAALATPALGTTAADQMREIAAAPDRFYVYGLFILLSSFLLVPAVFALVDLVRPYRAWGAFVAGVVAQIGMVVAIGDAASELVFWQMGTHGKALPDMVAVAEGYDNAPGDSVIYMIGGLCTMLGTIALGVLLWRTQALPVWAASALPISMVSNIAGFGLGSRALLAGSYLIMAAALLPAATALRKPRMSLTPHTHVPTPVASD